MLASIFSLNVIQTALELGCIYALVALALFLSYSILNIADLSTDGCFTLGCAVACQVALTGHPFLALLDMGLEDRMKQPVGLLSGGQRQALTLLMATLVTPKLLLLDEHTAALDPATAEKVLDLTKSIVAEKKITCLMVTHNMHQALELGNRTLMMDAGRIVFDVKGEARSKMTVDDLLEKFRENAGKALDNDRILLSKVEANN